MGCADCIQGLGQGVLAAQQAAEHVLQGLGQGVQVAQQIAGNVIQGLAQGGQAVQQGLIWLTDGPKRVFSNVNPMSDALKLFQRINDIVKAIFASSPIDQVSKAFGHVTDFIGARGIVGRVADLVSFRGAWEVPLFNGPNFLWVGNKVASLFGDIGSTVKWMASLNVFGSALSAQIKGATGQFCFGNAFNLLKGVGDFSCITSSLFDLADIARQAIDRIQQGTYFRDGAFMAKTAWCHAFTAASDVARVAGCVLSNIPGVHMVYSAIAGGIGSFTSLGKFYVEQYVKDPMLV
jgi:hypothetical protein